MKASQRKQMAKKNMIAIKKSKCDCHNHERQVCDICQGVVGKFVKDKQEGEIMTLRQQILAKIKEIKSTNQYKAKPATLQINAPLALIQLDLGSQVKALEWVLARMNEKDN